jgi:hypothetical protein
VNKQMPIKLTQVIKYCNVFHSKTHNSFDRAINSFILVNFGFEAKGESEPIWVVRYAVRVFVHI